MNPSGKYATTAIVLLSLAACGEVALQNSDFERYDSSGKAEHWYVPRKFRVESGAGSNGSAGLVYENDDDGSYYEIPSQRLDVVPGGVYHFGAWVCVEKLAGRGGVAVVLSWHDANGKWIGETQTSLLRKPTDGWVKLEGYSKPVAANAASGSLGMVVQRGVLGKVRFDRTFVFRHVRRPVVGLYTAAYRSEVADGEVRFAAALTPEAFGVPPADATAALVVAGPDGSTLSVPMERPAPDEARASIPAERFVIGTNTATCILSAHGREIGRASTTFVRVERPTPRRVSIDRFGRTLFDGRPFFPLGMYTGRMTAENVAMYAESDFNCLMQYGSPDAEQMKLFDKAGLKVIYDVAGGFSAADKGTNHIKRTIAKFGKHPAVLGWYIFDERPTTELPILEGRHDLIATLDPDHPTWCAQDIFSETRHYIGACDVFGGDPYPVSRRPVSVATDAIREENAGLMGMRPVWQVVQAFGWNWIVKDQAHQRRPTEQEMRNMAWQAVAGGARGLIFYSFGYLCREMERREPVEVLWPELKRIAAELKSRERELLFSDTAQIPSGELPDGVVGRMFRENGETWRLMVNTTAVSVVGMEPFGISFRKE